MNGYDFVEFIRDISGEGYDDIEMLRLINAVIYDINSRAIGGLSFLPFNVDSLLEDSEILKEHKISCFLKQREQDCVALITDGVVGRIKLIEEDYNSYTAYLDKYETAIQRYESQYVMVDMTGDTCSQYAYDDMDSFICTCQTNAYSVDHVHELKNVSVVNNRDYIKTVALGQYKNHNTVNNSPSAIMHRNGRR